MKQAAHVKHPAHGRQASRRLGAAASLGLLLALARLGPGQSRRAAPSLPASPNLITLRHPHTASEAARRAGWRYRVLAQIASNREREALEAWDPQALAGMEDERCRRQELAADRTGNQRRARVAAERAASLARTAGDRYQAIRLQVFLAHDAGRHADELRLARMLEALSPLGCRAVEATAATARSLSAEAPAARVGAGRLRASVAVTSVARHSARADRP